ncbi:ATP-dependent helicase [Thermithiobacillus plumbiphilus]|uniref:DNA 3'-5' helicase n=1 Tax=Thermithiobacillus plumbiphilus TaxID=1729899 RepID=A0ABU9D6T4_9PROT
MSAQSLTEEQERVVRHAQGHTLVAAVAGSGKTTTMIERYCHLLSLGTAADRILVLMFNKSAQLEFLARLHRRIELPARARVYTFHAYAYLLLGNLEKRGEITPLELRSEDWFWRDLATQALSQSVAGPVDDIPDKVDEFLQRLDNWKAEMQSPEELPRSGPSAVWTRAYILHEELRLAKNVRGFNDLAFDLMRALASKPERQRFFADRYDHVLVDEYQDINTSQFALVKILIGSQGRLMAVGDDDQSIYGWRGARPEFMVRHFEDHFPAAKRYVLSQTFRFGDQLARAASQLIARNSERIEKSCQAAAGSPATRVHLHLAEHYGQEAARIAGQGAPGNCVVLVRSYAQSALVEIAFTLTGIPYHLEGASPFHERAETLALLGYLALGSRPADFSPDETARMADKMLRIPGRYLDRRLLENARQSLQQGMPLNSWLAATAGRLKREAQAGQGRRFYALAKRLMEMLELLHTVEAMHQQGDRAADILDYLLGSLALASFFERNHGKEGAADRMLLCEGILHYAQQTGMDAPDFVAHLRGLHWRETGEDRDPDAILITSYHRAKGREWDRVILPDLSEDSLPLRLHSDKDTGGTANPASRIAEERRLFYVAMTRAREALHLIAPPDPRLGRRGKPGEGRCSPFLLEFDLPHT